MKLGRSFAVVMLAVSAVVTGAARAADETAEVVLGQRLDLTALNMLQSNHFIRPQVKFAEALYDAATRLDPNEPSYLRQGGELAAMLGEADTAIEKLTAYARKDPNDRVVQAKIIELYASRMQTTDAKIAYLNDILAKNPIAEEVRARAAVLLARIYLERSQTDQAIMALGQATRLNPLDPEANRLRYELLPATTTEFERFRALLAIIKSDPTEPGAIDAVAQMMSHAGLVNESLPWYAAGLSLHQRLSTAPDRAFIDNFAAALLVADQPGPADQIVTQMLQMDSSNSDALFIKLAIAKTLPDNTAQYEKAKDDARKAMTYRLAALAKAAGDKAATTQPTDTGAYVLPDMVALADRVKASGNREWIATYAQWATDLAWLDIYYDANPKAAAPVLEGLKHLTGPDDPVIARLQGWSYLVDGKKDQASVKLSAAADRDALAALGMVELSETNPAAKEQANLLGRKLLSEHPSGALGAQLYAALKPKGVQLIAGKTGDGINDELKKFPAMLLNMSSNPGQFFALRAEPINSTSYYAQPIFARVSLQNISDFDIPLGPNAPVKGDIWIDAQVRGADQQSFAPALAGQIGQRLVLRAREGIARTFRVDLTAFSQYLASQPQVSMPLSGNVSTNVSAMPNGSFIIGAAGERSPFSRMFERIGMNFTTEESRAKLIDQLKTASPGEKMRILQAMGAMAAQMKAAKNSADLAPVSTQLIAAIDRTRSDSSPIVSAWATQFASLLASDPADQRKLLESLENWKSWEGKLVALLEAQGLGIDRMREVANRLAKDSDPQIKHLAQALGELTDWIAAHPPQKPASTQPSK